MSLDIGRLHKHDIVLCEAISILQPGCLRICPAPSLRFDDADLILISGPGSNAKQLEVIIARISGR